MRIGQERTRRAECAHHAFKFRLRLRRKGQREEGTDLTECKQHPLKALKALLSDGCWHRLDQTVIDRGRTLPWGYPAQGRHTGRKRITPASSPTLLSTTTLPHT